MASLTLNTLRHGAVWTTVGQIAQASAQLGCLIVLARLLTPREYGVITAALIVLQAALLLAEFGILPRLVHRRELTPSDLTAARGHAMLAHSTVALLLACAAPLCSLLLSQAELTGVLWVYAMVVLVKGLTLIPEALSQRELAFKRIATVEGLSFLTVYLPLALALAANGFSYWSLALAQLAQVTAACIAWRYVGLLSFSMSLRESAFDWRYAYLQTLSRLGSWIATSADAVLVALFLMPARLGEYGRAQQLMVAPAAQIGQVLDRVLFPATTLHQAGSDAAVLFRRALTVSLALTLPLGLWLSLYASALVEWLLGVRWSGAAIAAAWLALSLPMRVVHAVCDATARAQGIAYGRAWRQWLYAVLLCALGLAWVGRGIEGVAAAAFVASVVDAVLMVQLCTRALNIPAKQVVREVIPALLLAALVALISALLTWRWPIVHLNLLAAVRAALPLIAALAGAYGLVRAWRGGNDRTLARQGT